MRIIVGTDGSPEAVEAVKWLSLFPASADTDVSVVSAAEAPTIPLSGAQTRVLRRALGEHADWAVSQARARLATRWPDAACSVLDGDPREAIPDVAGTAAADLVVVGSRGLSAVKSALMGSVSLAIARRAPCSVLVCRGAARPIRHVTAALDTSEPSRAALRFFEALSLPPDIAIRLVGVVEPAPITILEPTAFVDVSWMTEYEATQRTALTSALEAAAARLRRAHGSVEVATPTGTPAVKIVEEARTAGSDLIVVGARGLGALKRLLLGSVSEAVLRQASCPVLIVRTPREETP